MYSTIRYGLAGNVATITLNRPDRMNAFTVEMMSELIDAFDRVDRDDAVRAVIVTGEGRAFCAGADLAQGAAAFSLGGVGDGAPDPASEAARDGGGRLTLRIFQCLKPVIAAINGPAVGIGATMTLAMDIRLASTSARFGFVFASRGIVPEAASTWFLPRLVGVSQALEWCFTGRVFGADEALEGRLVKAVHAPDALLAAALALASEIAVGAAPVSIALTRQMMWRGMGLAHPMDAHRIESRALVSRTHARDAAEGVQSFIEKRPARFPDTVSADLPDLFPQADEPVYAVGRPDGAPAGA